MSCSSEHTYCDCDKISSKAIQASVGIPTDVDLDALEECGEKVKKDIDLNLPADQIGVDYIQQVSFEMCKYGFYEGKGSEHKKYYPISK